MMKKLITFLFLCFSLCLAINSFAQEALEIIAKAKQATLSLESVKLKGKTTTGSVDVTENQAKIDYQAKKFYAAETKDGKTLRSVYVINDIAYMYNGIIDSWFKFAKEVNPVGDAFNRQKLLSQFPENFSEAGFSIKLLDEQTVEGELCYLIESKVVDSEKATDFALRFLDQFVSSQIAAMLKENEAMLKNYLATYLSNSQARLWISKESFFIVKVENRNRQTLGPEDSISIEKETIYYDFNIPVEINLPDSARQAEAVSASDLGIKLK